MVSGLAASASGKVARRPQGCREGAGGIPSWMRCRRPGNCATCMAKVTKGHATLRRNDALTNDELAEGYVLTCQAIPDTDSITVDYE
ncbi:2Fe-2S iron-sulfur cluster-binding protein [Nocardia sp. CA-120079]|uniref:2Fe-2S iron-sulfur cluster-binding protein n=1 Tax=Nocardia sp. CA-120079 TaxID=3239974 RepID=UPI003D95CD10